MFDQLLATADRAGGSTGVVAWARAENAACAHRLAAMVTILDAAYAADGSADREQWYLDNWAAVSAQIGALQTITQNAASHQLLIATSLRDRLPHVADVFAQGLVTLRVVREIVSRTALITDADARRSVDVELATAIRDWEPMSNEALKRAVDVIVAARDPPVVRKDKHLRARVGTLNNGTHKCTKFWALRARSGM